MDYIFAATLGYALGCSNMALLLSKYKKVDLRAGGSGNPGASNAMLLMGWRAGITVGLHDIGKAVLAVVLARLLLSGEHIGAVAGVACVIGHVFPVYLRFRGGKGFASYVGLMLALNWKVGLILCAVVLAVTVITDFLVVGTFTTVTVLPLWLGLLHHSLLLALILLVGSGVIIFRHRENITRLRSGTEIGLRSATRGEHRKDQ